MVILVQVIGNNNPNKVKNDDSGVLIVVEGIDGSGKSTQIHLVDRWLNSKGYDVFFTEWNSSETVREITSKGKKKARLTPMTFSLLHSTDFADRYEKNIYPLLRAGYIVLADRYIYTALARDTVRGCDKSWVRNMYSYARKPDLTFYFRVPIETAVNRIISGRPKLKHYEAGMDLGLSKDEYESMVDDENFIVIDGTLDIEKQQNNVRRHVLRTLKLKNPIQGHTLE